ncbi:MAG: AAA family ATPase [Candidatus Thorarchaeota archaeon]
MEQISLQIEVYGEAGVGKTHFLHTMPDPYIIDLSPTAEGRINAILFGHTDVYEHCMNLSEVEKAIVNADHVSAKSICIDSSVYLQQMAVDDWLFIENQKRKASGKSMLNKVYPFTRYGEIRHRIDTLFSDVLMSSMNLVCTSQMQNQYDGDSKTGRRIPLGYPKLDFQSHVRIRLSIIGGKRICYIKKNRFVDQLGDAYFKTIPEPTFECLVGFICEATNLEIDNFVM